MPCRDQIYIVRSLILQLQKNIRQPLRSNLLARMRPSYLSILAINTSQGAAREKNRARAFFAREARLFPHMQRLSLIHISEPTSLSVIPQRPRSPAALSTPHSRGQSRHFFIFRLKPILLKAAVNYVSKALRPARTPYIRAPPRIRPPCWIFRT